MDALANASTVFANANCQIAWCAPSRNSFLSGRRPQVTQAYNFLDSFREVGPEWVTLPGYFRSAGFYTTSVGKVFHPDLPPNYDANLSWSDAPVLPSKATCHGNMMCQLPPGAADADAEAAEALIARLAARPPAQPFFAALGFQGPRLPWSYTAAEAARYPPAEDIPIAANSSAAALPPLEYFRPTEVDAYADVRNVTHDVPMPAAQQHAARRAYYATVSGVDTQLGRVLRWLDAAGLAGCTCVVLAGDHGQHLGELNLWSMMATLDTATRVPIIVKAAGAISQTPVYEGPVELVDLYPTLAALAGLPPPPAEWALPGVDLSPALAGQQLAKDAAFSQITRCSNCTAAYAGDNNASQCAWDAAADRAFTVPCCMAPREGFDFMGLSVRTREWRYSVFCRWNGTLLAPDFGACSSEQLYDHRGEGALQPLFRPDAECTNLAGSAIYASVKEALHARVVEQFAAK